jgi:hypothetical protein
MAGRTEPKIPTAGSRSEYVSPGEAAFCAPRPHDGTGEAPGTISGAPTKAVKVTGTGVKKTSTTGPARGTGSSFVLVLDAEGPADAASVEGR